MSGFPDISELQSQQSASQTSEQSHPSPNQSQGSQDQAASQAIYELEKLGRIKYKGEEWTPDALEKAILREKDYTKKTQSLGKDRESFEGERKFYENLHWDLKRVAENPSLVNAFIQTYPAKFHQYLKEYLGASQQNSQAAEKQQAQYTPDIDTMSRVERLEQMLNQQEIQKNEAQIQSMMDKFSKKYPDAMTDLVLASALELHEQGTKLDEASWEQIFKQKDAQGKEFVKARYGDLVKKQTSANEKARGVEPGGGAVGQAPKKFSKIEEIGKFAAEQLSQRNR